MVCSQAVHTAAVISELSTEIGKVLEGHPVNQQRRTNGLSPANMVLLRGCGTRINVASFEQLHGLKGCLVAPTKIIAGACGGWGEIEELLSLCRGIGFMRGPVLMPNAAAGLLRCTRP